VKKQSSIKRPNSISEASEIFPMEGIIVALGSETSLKRNETVTGTILTTYFPMPLDLEFKEKDG
jgi:hypothetical protein